MKRLAVQDRLAGIVARQRQEQIRVNVRHAGGQRILDIGPNPTLVSPAANSLAL